MIRFTKLRREAPGLKSYTIRKNREFPTQTAREESVYTGKEPLHGFSPFCPCQREGADARRIARRVLNTKLKNRAASPSKVSSFTYQVDPIRTKCDSCKPRNVDQPVSSSLAQHGDYQPPPLNFHDLACTKVMRLPEHNGSLSQSQGNTPNPRCMNLGSPKLRIPNKRYIVQTIRPFPGQRAEGKRSKTIIVTNDPELHLYTKKEQHNQRDQSLQSQVDYRKANFENFTPSVREGSQNDLSKALADVYCVRSSSLSLLLDEEIDSLNPVGDDRRQGPDKRVSTHFKSLSNQPITGRLTRDTYSQVNAPLTLREISTQKNAGSTRRDTCVQVSDGLTHTKTNDFSCLTREDNRIPEQNILPRGETCPQDDLSSKQDKFTLEIDGFVQRNLHAREVRGQAKRDKYTQENYGAMQKDKWIQENGSFAQKDKYTQENSALRRQSENDPKENSAPTIQSEKYPQENSAPTRQSEKYPQENCNVCIKRYSGEKKRPSTFNKIYTEETKKLTPQQSSPPTDCPCRLQKMNPPEKAHIPPQTNYRPENDPMQPQKMYRPDNVHIPLQTVYMPSNGPISPQEIYRPEDNQYPFQTTYRPEDLPMPSKDIYCPKHRPESSNSIHSPKELPMSPQEMYYPDQRAIPPQNMFYQEQQNIFHSNNQRHPSQIIHGGNNYFDIPPDVNNQEYRPQYQASSSVKEMRDPLFQTGFNPPSTNIGFSNGYNVRNVPLNRKDYDQCQRCEADSSTRNNSQNICSPSGAFTKCSEIQVAENVHINSYGNIGPHLISSQAQIVQARTVSQVGASPVHTQSNEKIIHTTGSPKGRCKSERDSKVESRQPERFPRAESPQNQRPKSEWSAQVLNPAVQMIQSENIERTGSPKSERLLRVKCTSGQDPQSEHYSRALVFQGHTSQSNRSLRGVDSHEQPQSERSLRVKGSLSPVVQHEKLSRVTSIQGQAFQNENIPPDEMNQVQTPTNRIEDKEYTYQSTCQGASCMNQPQQYEPIPGANRIECADGGCRRSVLGGRDSVPDKYCRDHCQNFSRKGMAENGQYQTDRMTVEGYSNSNVQQAERALRVAYCQGCLPSNVPGYSGSKTKTEVWNDNINQYGLNEAQVSQGGSNNDLRRLTRPPEYLNSSSPSSERQDRVDYVDPSSTKGTRVMPDEYTNVNPEHGYFQNQYSHQPYPSGCVGCKAISSSSVVQFNRNEPQHSQSFISNQREYIQEGTPQPRWGQPTGTRVLPRGGYNNGEIQTNQKYQTSGSYESRYCEDGVCRLPQNYSDVPSPVVSWSSQIHGRAGNRPNELNGSPEKNCQTTIISCGPECGSSSRTDDRNKMGETSYIIKTITKGTCSGEECHRIDPKCNWGCQNKEVQKRNRATSPTQEIDMSQNRRSSSGVTIKIKAGGKGYRKVSKACQKRSYDDNNNAWAHKSNQTPNSARIYLKEKGGQWGSSGVMEFSSSCTLIANPSCSTLHSPSHLQETAGNMSIYPRRTPSCDCYKVIKIYSKKQTLVA